MALDDVDLSSMDDLDDAPTPIDSPVAPDAATDATRDAGVDVVPTSPITARGGTVDLMHFGVFGDVRPPNENETASYPTAIVSQVFDGMTALNAQFAVGTGDYMFANVASAVNAQLDALTGAQHTHFANHIFFAMGNHECTGGDASNCPSGNETSNVMAFRSRLISDQSALWYDFTIHTSLGDAHFIVTSENAWGTPQSTWFNTAMAARAMYTIVVAHEPPTAFTQGPGGLPTETAIAMRTGGVSLRLYGHTHEYRRINPNGVVAGNAGATLSPTGVYGFVMVDQRRDGNLVVTAYGLGRPPAPVESWVVTPGGAATR